MNLNEQIYAQAVLLAGRLDSGQEEKLKILCAVTASALKARLRQGLTPEDYRADFIAAAIVCKLNCTWLIFE